MVGQQFDHRAVGRWQDLDEVFVPELLFKGG